LSSAYTSTRDPLTELGRAEARKADPAAAQGLIAQQSLGRSRSNAPAARLDAQLVRDTRMRLRRFEHERQIDPRSAERW
jgi:hypothetical protein